MSSKFTQSLATLLGTHCWNWLHKIVAVEGIYYELHEVPHPGAHFEFRHVVLATSAWHKVSEGCDQSTINFLIRLIAKYS